MLFWSNLYRAWWLAAALCSFFIETQGTFESHKAVKLYLLHALNHKLVIWFLKLSWSTSQLRHISSFWRVTKPSWGRTQCTLHAPRHCSHSWVCTILPYQWTREHRSNYSFWDGTWKYALKCTAYKACSYFSGTLKFCTDWIIQSSATNRNLA